MNFIRKKKFFTLQKKDLVLKFSSLILVCIFLYIVSYYFFFDKLTEIAFSILTISMPLTIIFIIDYLKDINEMNKKRKAYSEVEHLLNNFLVKTYNFFCLPREYYLSLKKARKEGKFFEHNKLFKEALEKSKKEIIEDFIYDVGKLSEDISLNINSSLVSEFQGENPLQTLENLTDSPFFSQMSDKDQVEIINLKKLFSRDIESVYPSIKERDSKNEIKSTYWFPQLIAFGIRRAVLTWYLIYCKANLLKSPSWEKVKLFSEKMDFDSYPM